MRKIIAILTIGLFLHTSIQAQKINVPVTCESPEFVDKVLKEYKEQPYFIGLDNMHGGVDLSVSVFLNSQTGTYSILFVIPNNNRVCIVSSGEKGKILHQQ